MSKVSIVIPNYNHARFLGQRLGCIERQTYKDFEVVFIDDASTDESVAVFAEFAGRHPCCRLERNACNSANVFKQWNKGLTVATGQYVWIAEADDYAAESFLESLVGTLDQNPQCGLAYCNSLRVDDAGRIIEKVHPTIYNIDYSRWERDFVSNGPEECFRYLLRENIIPNASAVVFRRELWQKVGGVDESFKVAGDWKFWASLLRISDIAFVAQPLNYFRVHHDTTRAKTRLWSGLAESIRVMKYILENFDVPTQALEDSQTRLLFTILHTFAERPTISDLTRVRKLISELQFRFSLRAVGEVIKTASHSIARRVRGESRQRIRV